MKPAMKPQERKKSNSASGNAVTCAVVGKKKATVQTVAFSE